MKMVAIKSFIPALVSALLFFTDGAIASPAPRKTSSAQTKAGSKTTQKPVKTQAVSQKANAVAAPKPTHFIGTESAYNGYVIACTETEPWIYTDENNKVISSYYCKGSLAFISTNTYMQHTYDAWASGLRPLSAPETGCKVDMKHDGSGEHFCICAGSPTSTVSTALAFSSGTTSTICNTGKGSVPTGWVEVPELSVIWANGGKDHEIWVSPPEFAVAGNCTSGEKLDPRCWDALNLDSYVIWWWKHFKDTCKGMPFHQCFFVANAIQAPTDCSIVGINGPCTAPDWFEHFKGKWNDVRNFYVAWNIYNMNYWFINWWAAVGNAHGGASAYIDNVTSIINPIKKDDITPENVMSAISIGLSFIPGPENAVAQALFTGAKQVPAVAGLLFPQGTEDSQKQQISDISVNLAKTSKALQKNIADSLPLILANSTNFIAFASTGAFSQLLPDINTISDQIWRGLMAYVISQSYQANGIFITRQLNTSVAAFNTNGTELTFKNPCQSDYDGNGVCDTFWYDKSDGTTYSLTSGDSANRHENYNSHMLKFFDGGDQAYTRPELIFRNAARCAAAAKSSKGPDTAVQISKNGFDTTCLSNMRVCTWALTPGKTGNDPLFTDCKDQDAFQGLQTPEVDTGVWCKAAKGVKPSFRVWRGYLGWGLLKSNTDKKGVSIFCPGDEATI